MTEPAIYAALRHYYPGWEAPRTVAERWNPCKCPDPSHEDHNPSASVHPGKGAFMCHSCGISGDLISLIRDQEGVNYRDALERAETFAPGISQELRRAGTGLSARRLFGEKAGDHRSGPDQAPGSGVRRRAFPRP
ncbi:hypothetical protein FAB82_17510 [Glycomyces buryatensis]|uniref:Zinc finger CHC2-type domain-containing protein n=1 Tax=Glycomyces buryatensis TaxID=2570927 RepID=A0A4V4HRX7_9ACTN|nr:hypothetical protein FAB82_17510 [Glycomyces buryatensis]